MTCSRVGSQGSRQGHTMGPKRSLAQATSSTVVAPSFDYRQHQLPTRDVGAPAAEIRFAHI